MSQEARIEALKAKHADLELKLEEESNRPMPDDVIVHNIKREKLSVKDELQRLVH